MKLTVRNRNVISGLIALVLLFAAIDIGVSASFGAFDDTYILKGSFDAAGQGLQKGSDVKIRGVNVGKVVKVDLVDGRALVTMDITASNRIPESAIATVRAKTLFGEKFVDIAPGSGEASGPFYSKNGELLDKCDKNAQPEHTCTVGGFELEKVLGDAYPLLKQIQPSELMTVIHTLAEAGRDLGPSINRQIVNSEKVLDVNAAHDADTRQFLADLAKLAQQLGVRADDLVTAADDLNIALPTLNARADKLNSLLVQTARLSNDVADLLRNNKDFIDKSFGGGQEVLNVLYDQRNDIVPLIIGLREYLQTLTEITRIPTGTDGTLMAAVKSLTCPAPGVFGCTGPSASALSQSSAGAASAPGGTVGPDTPVSDPTGVQQLLAHLAMLGAA
ncbi:MAG: phospholipid/cholesterol/gamma-HCH transport system substrate-binding protein [Acidimicrobiaceae bacterium]